MELQSILDRYKQERYNTKEFGYVIPLKDLEKALGEFQNKPFEDRMEELNTAMKQLTDLFDNIGNKLND